MTLLDTNVISELMRATPAPSVVNWVSARPSSRLFTSAVSEAEILYGVALLPTGRRRSRLQDVVRAIFSDDFVDRVLPFDRDAARAFAEIAAARRRAGRPIAQLDAQIAAIALSRGAALATRNTRDFEGCGVKLVDPWSAAD